MDESRVDALSRSLAAGRSRRGLTRLLAALAVTGPVARRATTATSAKRKKGKKHKHQRRPCIPACAGKVCGDDGCGGICGMACTGGRTCQGGVCTCPDGTKLCAASQSCRQCCTKADCTPATSETGSGIPECSAEGVCVCATAGTRPCPGRGRCGFCCSTAECATPAVCDDTSETLAFSCGCPFGTHVCTAAGRTGCIEATAACQAACNGLCNPQHPTPCACGLVCDPVPGEQDYRCAVP